MEGCSAFVDMVRWVFLERLPIEFTCTQDFCRVRVSNHRNGRAIYFE